MNLRIILSLVLLFTVPMSNACINTYAFELGGEGMDQQRANAELNSMDQQFKTHQELNDYGVMLIYAHQYEKAIQVFKEIEKTHHLLAKTAANLGTAYELNGEIEKAQYWIAQGIKRNPHIHDNSEWIHLKILDAKLAQKQNPDWINKHDVLGLDFGLSAAPKAKVEALFIQNQNLNLETILEHSKVQMDQRLRFVHNDPITAQILFNMANIEAVLFSGDEDTIWSLYQRANSTGFQNKALIEQRMNYIGSSNWYAFKRFLIGLKNTSLLCSHN